MQWKLAQSLGSRVAPLADPPKWDDIIRSVSSSMTIQCVHGEDCERQAGFYRVVYCLLLEPPLFDLFFNSVQGYRAWYYRSPFTGLQMNAGFIDEVRPRLLKFGSPGGAHVDAEDSLRAVSAKVWLAEVGKGLERVPGDACEYCAGEWSAPDDDIPEILNGRWETVDHAYARYGRKAPYLARLKVFGGFVNENRDEFIPSQKRARHFDIFRHGWS